MKRAVVAAALCGCGGSTGTLSIGFTGAPGANLLAGAQSLRVVLTNPSQTYTIARTSDGFDLDFDFGATSNTGQLEVTALDAGGAVVAYGETPPLPLDAVTAAVSIYLGAPLSIGASPAALATAAGSVGAAVLPYGAVIAGGADASDAPVTDLGVYNAYDHTLTAGVAMPSALVDAAMTATSGGQVYLFGGLDASGAETSQLWRFDTTVSPAGEWITVDATTTYARSGERMFQTDDTSFVVTGDPALSVTTTGIAPLSEVATLPAQTAAITPGDGDIVLLGVTDTGLVRLRAGVVDQPSSASLANAAVAALPPDAFVVVGGDLGLGALRVDAATGAVTPIATSLSVARTSPSVAATSRYVVVASDGSCDVLAAADLSLAATVPCADAAQLVALPNDQIMLLPGTTASTEIDLFTPDPPP
ncbi:MAG TPA: kelch repeat-containing protein [Kofleriaceae bacterium]|jgi:hypothetical protein